MAQPWTATYACLPLSSQSSILSSQSLGAGTNMAAYGPSVFPMELYHAILDHLRLGNLSTLGNCALVCSAWRSIVQRWMFSKLVIRLTPTHVDEVHTFFTESSPYLSEFVRTLELAPPRAQDASSVSHNTSLELLSDNGIFKLFINVDNLHLGYLNHRGFVGRLTAEQLTLLSQLANVRELHMTAAWLPPIHYLTSTFPSLRSLMLGSGTVYSGARTVSFPAIQRLAFHVDDKTHREFPTSFNFPSLRHFAFRWHPATAYITQPLLESIPYEQIQRLNLFGSIAPLYYRHPSYFNSPNDFLGMSLFLSCQCSRSVSW